MPIKFYTRKIHSPTAAEIYISVVPDNCAASQKDISEIFAGIVKILKKENASILLERVFTIDGQIEKISAARKKAYGKFDDGVAPSFLTSKEGKYGVLSGVQVHAITGVKPEKIKIDGKDIGRFIKTPKNSYVALSAICGNHTTSQTQRAREMFEIGQAALKQVGGGFHCVPRTWLWLGDILSWYGDFNKVRNQFFTELGLIGQGSRQSMPASTGIGLSLTRDGQFGMDLTAALEPAGEIEFLSAGGKQQCALNYGSAFSRASRATTPAGKTIYVSGTASIDAKGATTHIGDAKRQIEATIENVRAILKDTNCKDEEVVHVIAYSKTREVEEAFEEYKKKLDWPWITTICDICRDDLLFEIEATAMPGAK